MTTRNQPPPPPVNAADAVQPDQPDQPKRRGVLPDWAAPVAGGVGLIIGAVLGGVIMHDTDDTTAAPKACLEAIDYADEIIGITSESFLDIADAVDALMVYDFDTADRHMDGISRATDQIVDIRDDYLDAKAQCRG